MSIAFGRVLRIIRLRGAALLAAAVVVALVGCLWGCGSGDAMTGAEYVHEPRSQPPTGLFAHPEQAYWSEEEGFAPDAARVITALSFQLGLEQYYSQHGAYPQTLDELLPDFAPIGEDGLPIASQFGDPWAKSLRYWYLPEGQTCGLSIVLDSGREYELTLGEESAADDQQAGFMEVLVLEESAAKPKVVVRNGYQFWARLAVGPSGGDLELTSVSPQKEVAGLWASAGYLPPEGEASYWATSEGSGSVEMTGMWDMSANQLQVLADALNVRYRVSSSEAWKSALNAMSTVSLIVDLHRVGQHLEEDLDLWRVMELFAKSISTEEGQTAITDAFDAFGVTVPLASLQRLGSLSLLWSLGRNFSDSVLATVRSESVGAVTLTAAVGVIQAAGSSGSSGSDTSATTTTAAEKDPPAGLTRAAASMWTRIREAAHASDHETLAALAVEDGFFEYGGVGVVETEYYSPQGGEVSKDLHTRSAADLAEVWRNSGEVPWLLAVLDGPHTYDDVSFEGLYAWPCWPWEGPDAEYNGYFLLISKDGEWVWFGQPTD